MPDQNRVSATLAATIAQDGTGAAIFTIPSHQSWTIERLAATGTSSPTAVSALLVYRSAVLIDSTGYPVADTSESATGIDCLPGDQIRAQWYGCTPGATMQLLIEGTGG